MKLSFSTRGWGDIPWDELVSTAADMGFAGVEVYDVIGNSRFSGKGGPFEKYNLRATVRNMRARELQIPVFDPTIDISVWLPARVLNTFASKASTAPKMPCARRSMRFCPTPRSSAWCC